MLDFLKFIRTKARRKEPGYSDNKKNNEYCIQTGDTEATQPKPPHVSNAEIETGLLPMQEFIDKLPDLIYIKDINSRFLMVNNALAVGIYALRSPAQAIGRTDFDYWSQQQARQFYENEQMIIRTGKPMIDMEEKNIWPDGHVKWLLTSKYPLKDSHGTITGIWGISRDITRQKQIEEDLAVSEAKFRQAQKMEAFGQLSGGIAHDFNNMLSIILGSAQLINMKLEDANPEMKENLNILIDATTRAADLTQKLLTFARKGTCNVVPLEINEVIRSVIGLLKHTLGKNIRIVECLNAAHSQVLGDYVQIQNALLNLAINARDAMPGGGVLTFATEEIFSGENLQGDKQSLGIGNYLRVTVTDTGTGMDEHTKIRAFEPFFTTKEVGKGTGLGLSSVYGTIKSHNGLIELDSELSKGTTFKIFLPLIHKTGETPVVGKPVTNKGTGTILVVDDEEDIRIVISQFLGLLGYAAITCRDGMDAVKYYEKHVSEIDALIIDNIMPHMTGLECVKKIKQINAKAIILISSGYNLVSDTQQIITNGISGFIQKPFKVNELAQALTDVLKK